MDILTGRTSPRFTEYGSGICMKNGLKVVMVAGSDRPKPPCEGRQNSGVSVTKWNFEVMVARRA